MFLETHRRVWPNDDVVGAEGATPGCSEPTFVTRPVLVLASGFMGLPQRAPSLLTASWLRPVPNDHTQPTRPHGFGKMWTENVPGGWQEGLTVRGQAMKEGETVFCRAARCEAEPESSGSAAKPRNLLQPKLPDPSLSHPSG